MLNDGSVVITADILLNVHFKGSCFNKSVGIYIDEYGCSQ